MCFSATASFSAGAVLTVIGYSSIKKVNQSSQYLFAAIPLLFAVQQFAEGILWIVLPSESYMQLEKIATSVFIIIAQIVWPFWVPLSIQQVERNIFVRKILSVFTGLGIIVSLCFLWLLLTYGVSAKIDSYHISYPQNFPVLFSGIGGYFYVIVTIFPPFLSNYRRMWLLGLVILISYLITDIYFDNYFISVWCFFAAVISSTVYWIIKEIKSKTIKLYPYEAKDLQ